MKRLCLFFAKRSESIAFDGSPGPGDDPDVDSFITAVQKYSFLKGKHGNNLWTAQFASTCSRGGALRWYEALPEATQNDWRQLREALTTAYAPAEAIRKGPATTSPISGRPLKPSPPAASLDSSTPWEPFPKRPGRFNEADSTVDMQPPSRPARQASPLPNVIRPSGGTRTVASLNAGASSTSPPVGGRRGIIEVSVLGWRPRTFYVSKALHHDCFTVSAGKATALRVQYYRNNGDVILENCDSQFASLGLTWSSKTPDLKKSSSDSAQLAAVGGHLIQNEDIPTSSSWCGVTWESVWQVGRKGVLAPSSEP